MRTSIRRLGILAGCIGILAAGKVIIPLLEAVSIGTVEQAVSLQTTLSPPATQPIQSGIVLQPIHEAAAPTIPTTTVIPYESDGSAAMHASRAYHCPDSDSGGKIIEKHYGTQSGTMFFSLPAGGQVRNSTFWRNDNLLEESRQMPVMDIPLDGSPAVLIYHTHTTESYMETNTGGYDSSFNFRTTEPDKDMVAVGAAIAEELAAAGIGVVHATELHDYPVWSGAYSRSAETIQAVLAQYPSICVALDIHRDAISSGSTVYAPVCSINGKQAAQIMIISGCDDGTMNMPDYRENFHFASRLQETAETMFTGFTRPILFDYRKYNQNLCKGGLLIEVGSQGNTLEEARYAGELVGQALVETLRTIAAANEQGGTE